MDDISLVGRQYREDESSTEALGRMLYKRFYGREPRAKETRTLLSYLVHWTYGILQGGVYGVMRRRGPLLDLEGGAAFGSGLWLFGDELAVPMLGLQGGPTAVEPEQHLNRWGAHLVYGMVTAVTTQLLHRML